MINVLPGLPLDLGGKFTKKRFQADPYGKFKIILAGKSPYLWVKYGMQLPCLLKLLKKKKIYEITKQQINDRRKYMPQIEYDIV